MKKKIVQNPETGAENCAGGETCECGENCQCGENCNCGEACTCGENCACKNAAQTSDAGATEIVDNQAAKIAELTADLQRTRADFENFRKQVEIQKENERKNAKIATVLKFLPLLDNFSLALGTYQELKPLKKTLEKTLKDLNLEPIPSAEGTEFNPDLFDAAMVEGDGEKEVVAETLRPGYYYEKEVLRPAMVKVKRV